MDLNIPSRVKILEKFDVADRLSFARDFTAKFLFVGRRGLMSINIFKTVPNYAEEDIFFFLALRSVWQNKCTSCTRSNLQIFHAS